MREFLQSEIVNVEFTMQLKSGSIRTVLPVPSGQATITDLLPILQQFTSRVASDASGRAAADGKPVTCGPKCGACCQQLVPISPFEAEALAEWIRSLPEDQQQALSARFYHAILALQKSGILQKLNPQMFELPKDEFKRLGIEYHSAGVPCPFLDEGSCGIYPIRPLICREYMVVSPPVHCADPALMQASRVVLPFSPSRAMIVLGKRVEGDAQGWLPLVFLFQWMKAGIKAGASVEGPGPEVLREFIEALTGQSAS